MKFVYPPELPVSAARDDIAQAVRQSMEDLAKDVKTLKGSTAKGSFSSASNDSGSKTTLRRTPRRPSYESGSKYNHGGK